MGRRLNWKNSRLDWLSWLYGPMVVLLAAAFAYQKLRGGDDFWAHAAVGRWIWDNSRVPHQTLFIWSAPPIPWVAHSWLTQLIFYGLMSMGGPRLVVGVTMLLSALTFGLLWRLWRRRARITSLTPLIFALAIWCAAPRFHPRPELFTALFFTWLLAFLVEWSAAPPAAWDNAGSSSRTLPPSNGGPPDAATGESPSDKAPAEPAPSDFESVAPGLIVLFVVWANFHGAVAAGLLLLGLAVVFDLIQDRFAARARVLAVIAVLCLGAVFVNPFGLHYLQALMPVEGAMFSNIDEWKSIWGKEPLDVGLVIGEVVLALIALTSWVANSRRRWAHLAWLVAFCFLFVQHRRFLWLLALVSLAVIAANAPVIDTERLWSFWRRRTRPIPGRPSLDPAAIFDAPADPLPVAPAARPVPTTSIGQKRLRLPKVFSLSRHPVFTPVSIDPVAPPPAPPVVAAPGIAPLAGATGTPGETGVPEIAPARSDEAAARTELMRAFRPMTIPLGLRRVARVGVTICLITWIAVVTPSWFLSPPPLLSFVPEGAATFIQRQHLPGHVFNDYEYSSYLQWRLAGHPPLFIDLLNAYPDRIMDEYLAIINAGTQGRALLNKRHIGYVVLRRHGPKESVARLAKYLDGNAQWARVYSGEDASIWVRRNKTYELIWRRFGQNPK